MEWYSARGLKVYFSVVPKIMERFLAPYNSIEEKRDILAKPYKNLVDLGVEIYYKDKSCDFVIPMGYCFDGASIPRVFWRVVGAKTDNTFLVASMVHDYLCENHSLVDNDRYLSTLVFDALLEVGGVSKLKRWFMKHSVDNYQKFCSWR